MALTGCERSRQIADLLDVDVSHSLTTLNRRRKFSDFAMEMVLLRTSEVEKSPLLAKCSMLIIILIAQLVQLGQLAFRRHDKSVPPTLRSSAQRGRGTPGKLTSIGLRTLRPQVDNSLYLPQGHSSINGYG